jgi:hypothetical protein
MRIEERALRSEEKKRRNVFEMWNAEYLSMRIAE